MKNFTLECCVDSTESAIAAMEGGAHRLELCADLPVGGTTPGIHLFRQVRRCCTLPIRVLLRPRFGDFCYSDYERELLLADARMFATEGADALVMGALTPDGDLDLPFLRELAAAAGGTRITLHRAFDLCADPYVALEQAISLGVSTILTSGQKATAMEGAALIRGLGEAAKGRIELLAGSGVSSKNIAELAAATRTASFHLSGKKTVDSRMTFRRTQVPMGLPLMSEYDLWRTDAEEIRRVGSILEAL